MSKKTSLQSVDFILANGRPIPGLVAVHGGNIQDGLSVDEQVAVFDARLLNQIDYVYFRRFSDGRSSQIAAYVIDNSDEKLSENELSELHRQVWLQGTTPLLYIAWPSRIDILACAREPDFWNEEKQEPYYNPARQIKIAAEISDEMRRFSAFRLADGTFWDDPHHAELAKHDKAAHQSLIQAVIDVDKEIHGEKPVLRRLLLLMILIKYLEDRKVFPGSGWFGRFHKGARGFFDVLKGGDYEEVWGLLDALKTKFNGDVFDLSSISQRDLTKKNLKAFADLVDAKTIRKQKYLWEQFSFEHLPVEIISHLYQHFIEDGHGAVYTPPFLAGLLLDHVMPYKNLSGNERILDPACGSGVFLVGAFRRLVNFWRSKHSWKRPTVDILKKILKQSIYGVDLDSNAIDLTAFSLSLALCDALQPKVIWENLRFDRLRGMNLFKEDFFQLLLDTQQETSTILSKKFDVVIGNPPFESELTAAGKKIDEAAQQQDAARGKCPDNQTAYLFLEQVLTVLYPDKGKACLIQPSGFLYNLKVSDFRNNLFRRYKIDTIYDLTSIRKLYQASKQTVAMSACNTQPADNHRISHWTFRRTASVNERICFELDHYDYHHVSQKQVEIDSYIWRANLLGGGRLVDLSRRLRNVRPLVKYIEEKGWDYGEGFIVGNRKNSAPFLTGKLLLPTKAFTPEGIDDAKLDVVRETHFEGPRYEDMFSSPLLLIKELDSLPLGFWDRKGDKKYLVYNSRIVGIHSPRSDEPLLRKLYCYLLANRTFLQFCIAIIGTQALIDMETTIRKQDIDALPYPENESEISLSFWEKILCEDAVDYMAKYIRCGQDSELLQKEATGKHLKEYSDLFVKMLGSVYDNLKASKPIFLTDSGIICQPFYFGDKPTISWLDDAGEKLRELIYYQNHEHLRTVRLFRFYDKNVMLIVKPNRLRYWIRSTAIRDADETLVDLREQGY